MHHQVTPAQISIKNVLFATDFSDCSFSALRCVTPIVEAFGSHIYLAHVIPSERERLEFAPTADLEPDQVERDADRMMDGLLRANIFQQIPHEALVLEGGICSSLVKACDDYRIDLLVLGASGADHPSQATLGSVAMEILHCAPCPVLTVGVGKTPHGSTRRILCATDFTERSDRAMVYALCLAGTCNAQLMFLQATEQPPPLPAKRFPELWSGCEDSLLKLLPLLSSISPEPECRLQLGVWTPVVLEMAQQWQPDLIVMDFNLGLGFPRLPGKVAQEIVRRAPSPVLVVREGGHGSTLSAHA